MSDDKKVKSAPERGKSKVFEVDLVSTRSEVSSVAGSTQPPKAAPRVSSSSERQIKFERAQKCLENAALVSKRIKEHRKQTAELLGRPFEEDDGGDTGSEVTSTMSERTGYSAATDVSTLSVQDALNIPGISESLANTLKQKELLMERIKQYKEISKRPMKTSAVTRKETHITDSAADIRKIKEGPDVNQQLQSTLIEKENALSVIQVKMRAMETTILDLQEKLNEKDQIIDAKNKATSLMSDSLSKKDTDSFALLEDTRQQMIKMQENFISMETEWKDEKHRLVKQLAEKDDKIHHLEEANTILENARFEISLKNSKLTEELELKDREIIKLHNEIDKLSIVSIKESQQLTQKEKEDCEEEKGSIEIANMVELTKKIELLEQLNCQIRQTNKELENKLASVNPEAKSTPSGSPSKKSSPLPSRKGSRAPAKQKSPWSKLSTESLPQETEKKSNNSKNELNKLEMVVQSLNKDILEKEYVISQKDSLIFDLQNLITQNEAVINELKSSSNRETIDIGVITEPIQSDTFEHVQINEEHMDPIELATKLKSSQNQITSLNEEIDAANKNMIKVKSSNKLKVKQMQKTIDNLSVVGDSGAEIVRLNEMLHQLSVKVAELEEEKGNLQLHLVDYDSGRLTDTDVYKKMVEMEGIAEARLNAISLLEAQKFDLVQELHELQQKNCEMEDKLSDLAQLESEQVSSEIKSVQLEEQIDQLQAEKKESELIIENLKLDKKQLEATIKAMEEEKEELLHKLENYVHENMELTDKLEKLSTEKVSSAESIEIVESLTIQEKLELEEYNKGLINKPESHDVKPLQKPENIEKFVEQSAELNKKIELFTEERQEVMEKMSKITADNNALNQKITEYITECKVLQKDIDVLQNEKQELVSLNEELNKQIEELKRERIDIMKESVELIKPSSVEDADPPSETLPDDKTGDKNNKGAKTVKQLTKDILKLKNIIKDREAEIGDCQMKILSLEEQQQKQQDLLQSVASYETKVKSLLEENKNLKDELETANKNTDVEQQMVVLRQTNDALQQEMQNMHQEYKSTINLRDSRVLELENLLAEYEKQLFNYGSMLQQKDKELADYVNQITKLNDVSQKLKSTIEVLEEEKAKDPNGELVKSLNKQIAANQKKLTELEEKIRILDEERTQLLSAKETLESTNATLETELKKVQDALNEEQTVLKELQSQAQKHIEELKQVSLQVKERDEEIHEIKLQLRKESIENEKLRKMIAEKENEPKVEDFSKELDEVKEQLSKLTQEKEELSEQSNTLEIKNKELLEKLKKYAISIKKKSSMYNELQAQLNEANSQLEAKNSQLEQLLIQVDALPMVQDKLKHAEEELNRLHSQKSILEQQIAQNAQNYSQEIESLTGNLKHAENEIFKSRNALNTMQKELYQANEEKANLKTQFDALSNKFAAQEIEQKNSSNFVTKIASLESDINQKQNYIAELLSKLEHLDQQLNQLQFGHDAKIQEHNLYVESLESEILKYKNRICRLEDSISAMEDRRNSLERKADQLDSQLQEKQKAYTEYTSQEDQLVGRLAALMDHDRVVDKQLHEIDNENRELQNKVQSLTDETQHLKRALSDIQEYCNTLVDKANKADNAEAEIIKYQSEIRELDANLKRITHEHQTLLTKGKQDIEELESEFNVQIENAIKEKKVLSEKYEKTCEHIAQLESKLQEYENNMQTLKVNIDELNRVNYELAQKSKKEKRTIPDYTDEYLQEINRLNTQVSAKNERISDLNNTVSNLQTNYMTTISHLEYQMRDINEELKKSSSMVTKLTEESNVLKSKNKDLESLLSEKDEQVRESLSEIEKLTEEYYSLRSSSEELKTLFAETVEQKKHYTDEKLTFDVMVPKTEGLVISSTIEAYDLHGSPQIDVSGLESQILTNCKKPHTATKAPEQMQKKSIDKEDKAGPVSEDVIVAKKAYLCYKEEDKDPGQPEDLFNSDEGWGLGETEDVGEITHLSSEIEKLKKENDSLKSDVELTKGKLIKVMKKFKELKSSNEMLTKELQLSKQLSQSSFLDNAIEDELKTKIEDLERKIEELNSDLQKEKREKESVRKQNEVFHSANDRLTETKEKLDSEIALWKFKFKEANDKLSTMQWGSDSPVHQAASVPEPKLTALQDDFIKLERENDDLQLLIDQLTGQNKYITTERNQLKTEVSNLKQQLEKMQSVSENIASLQDQLTELHKHNSELLAEKELMQSTSEDILILQNKLTNIMEHNTELLAEKDALFKTIQDLRLRQEELQKLYTELLAEKKTSFQTIQDLQSRCDELEAIDKKSDEFFQTSHKQLQEKHRELSNVSSELESYKAKLLHLRSQQTEIGPKIQAEPVVDFSVMEKYVTMENYCQQIKQQLDNANSKIIELETENHALKQITIKYEQEIEELKTKIQNLNSENDQLLSTVTELRSSISGAVDQRGFEIAELWKQHLAQREADFQKNENELRSQLSAYEAKYEQLLDSVQGSSQEEANTLVMAEQVASLQNKLQDKEEHLRNLQEKYAEVISQIDLLRSEMEDEKVECENKILRHQEEYEKQILDLTLKNQQHSDGFETTYQNLKIELGTTKAKNEELSQELQDLLIKVDEYNSKVADLTNQLKMKEAEIYQKSHDYTITINQRNEEFENVRKQLLEYEKKIEDLTFEKESELAVLRLKMHEKKNNYRKQHEEVESEKLSLSDALNEKIVECTNLNKQIADLNNVLAEYANNSTQMQGALENQEIEIVSLKEEIASLRETFRRSPASKMHKHVTFAADTKSPSDIEAVKDPLLNRDLLDAVPRAELDLALYMLHQRDVRCEELTMELTRLLDERDTLQLRLSDSIRSFEDLKSNCSAAGLDLAVPIHEAIAELPSVSYEREHHVETHRGQSSRSSSIGDPDGDKPKLQAKLSELRSVRHSRDVLLRHDSEQRQLDLRLLQRDVANLPPEARDQLAQAHHTLSRDSQSTPTVLLNWLRGKSTPKVVHM